MQRDRKEEEAYAVAALADGSIGRALEASADEVVEARDVAIRVLAQAAASDDARRRMESAKELVVKGSGAGVDRARSARRRTCARWRRCCATSKRLRPRRIAPSWRTRTSRPKLERLTAFAGDRGRQAFQAIDRALSALERYTNAKLVADWLVLQL